MKCHALLTFIDLDGMKPINDYFGHEQGDQALRDTAKVLLQVFRESDLVARLGGDEFVVLVTDADVGIVPIVRSRLDAAVTSHNEEAHRPYKLAMSLGFTHYDPAEPREIDALLASADAVMYEQKALRKTQAL